MFFGKKNSSNQPASGNSAPPPPWENIDKVPKKQFSSGPGFDLTDFTDRVTGFGRLGSKILLFGLGLSLGFIAYILFDTTQKPGPRPPAADRPAIDKDATSTTPQ